MTEKKRSRAQVLANENRRLRTLIKRAYGVMFHNDAFDALIEEGKYKQVRRSTAWARALDRERRRGGW